MRCRGTAIRVWVFRIGSIAAFGGWAGWTGVGTLVVALMTVGILDRAVDYARVRVVVLQRLRVRCSIREADSTSKQQHHN